MRAADTLDRDSPDLEALYEFREPAEVASYLAANPDLLPLLVEAAAKLREAIPGGRHLVLYVLQDPECESDPGELFAIIQTPLDPDIVQPAMHRLIRQWLIHARRPAIGRFNVAVEYV